MSRTKSAQMFPRKSRLINLVNVHKFCFSCRAVPRRVCKEVQQIVPREVCRQLAPECEIIQEEKCEEVVELICQDVHNEEFAEECNDVQREVCKEVERDVCIKDEACLASCER